MTLDLPRAKKLAFAIGALAGLSTLRAGFFSDDHAFRAMVRGMPWINGGNWDLYAFAPGNADRFRALIVHGPYPWWTPEALRVHFLRPLSSLALWFDVTLFGDTAWLAHLHSVAWWLLALAAVVALLERLVPGPVAALAMVLYALDDAHCFPVTWLANRHAIISGACALWGFWCWVKWRQDGVRWGQAAALACFALALSAGESALNVLAFVGAWELFGREAPLRQRVLSLFPLGALGLVYVAIYRAAGFGTWGSGVYVDPGAQPGVFLSLAPGRFLALLAPLTLNVASDPYLFDARAGVAIASAGAVGAGLWAFAFHRFWPSLDGARRNALRWLLPAMALSILPSLATFPSDRMLFAASIGGAVLLAMLIEAAWARGGWAKRAIGLLTLPHLLVPLGTWAVVPPALGALDQRYQKGSLQTELSKEALTGRVIFVTAPDMIAGLYSVLHRFNGGLGLPRAWNLLSVAPQAHRLTRTGEQTLELEALAAPFLASPLECLFRNPTDLPFSTGDRTQLDGSDVTVLAVKDGFPTRIRFNMDAPPSAYTFVHWSHGRIEALALPEIGQSVELLREPSPIEQALGLAASD